MAVSAKRGSFKRVHTAPLKEFGVDTGQARIDSYKN